MSKSKTLAFSLVVVVSTFFSIDLVAAKGTYVPMLDNMIELVSQFFYPSILLRNQNVQIGFYKFLYFIIIFSAVNWVLNKFLFNKGGDDKSGKRAASVIAFAFAAIAAWFMPKSVALGSAGLITAVLNSIIPVGLSFAAVYVAFYVLKGEKGWWEHLIGASLLLFALIILSWTLAIIG